MVDGWRVAHLVLNPAADRGRAAACQGRISSYLEGRGVEVVWHPTEGRGHARQIASRLPDEALVVAVGGDGTVHEVAAACAKSGRVVGVLPVGSGNDYAKALGIGTNLGRALEVVAGGRLRSVDTGEVNGVRFNNGLGIGFDAEVAAGVAAAPEPLGGFGAYLWSAVRLLWGMRCHGARFRIAPESSLDDGVFDVVWSEEVRRTEVLRLIPAVLRGTHLSHPKIHFARTAEIAVSLAEPTTAHVDGEILSPTRDFQARVLPRSLRVLVPQPVSKHVRPHRYPSFG